MAHGRGDGDGRGISDPDSASDEDLMLEDHPPGNALAMLKSKVVHRSKFPRISHDLKVLRRVLPPTTLGRGRHRTEGREVD